MASSGSSIRFKDHPKGLFYLFFAEMWERFSYYGLRALLVLYMTSELRYEDSRAYGIYAAYCTLVYLLTIAGGMIADQCLGNRKAIISGGILITGGHVALACSGLGNLAFYCGLAFIIAGTGLFKANISTLVGQLYSENDRRRDAGFTLFYIGINIGGLLAPLTCGFIGQVYGWHYGFGLASIGMFAGLLTFLRGQKVFADKGLPPALAGKGTGRKRELVAYAGALASVPLFTFFLFQYTWFEQAMPYVALVFVLFCLRLVLKYQGAERRSLIAIFTLMFFQTAFFSIFDQAGTSMQLFTARNIDRTILGFDVPATVFNSLNSFFIIVLGPLFAALWVKLARRQLDPSPAIKFALALTQVALGFGALYLGTKTAGTDGLTSVLWLVAAYLLHTTGELCIMPVGLSMVSKMAPRDICSTVMGLWFVSIAFSQFLVGVFSKLASVTPTADGVIDPLVSLPIYGEAFYIGMAFALGMSLLLFIINPLLRASFARKSGASAEEDASTGHDTAVAGA